MGEIRDYAAEYATVQRLSKMLEITKEDYKATEAYALFTAILCWVMQRVRTPEHHNGLNDDDARSVRDILIQSKICDEPWNIDDATFPQDYNAFKFFKNLRDAVAHGDARRIRPINKNRILVGYQFEFRENNGQPILPKVELKRADMVRLGCALADIYCEAMVREPDAGDVAQNAAEIKKDETA